MFYDESKIWMHFDAHIRRHLCALMAVISIGSLHVHLRNVMRAYRAFQQAKNNNERMKIDRVVTIFINFEFLGDATKFPTFRHQHNTHAKHNHTLYVVYACVMKILTDTAS